jgi:rRNA maturation endonuclease Nob1
MLKLVSFCTDCTTLIPEDQSICPNCGSDEFVQGAFTAEDAQALLATSDFEGND